MADRRPAKEHLTEVSQELSEHFVISSATCRRAPKRGFVGAYIDHTGRFKGSPKKYS